MSKQSWKTQERPTIGLCDCDNPAPLPKQRHGRGAGDARCSRCRELERNPVMDERCGYSQIWDIPRSTLIQIRRACDAWLRSRGLSTETGHSYVADLS